MVTQVGTRGSGAGKENESNGEKRRGDVCEGGDGSETFHFQWGGGGMSVGNVGTKLVLKKSKGPPDIPVPERKEADPVVGLSPVARRGLCRALPHALAIPMPCRVILSRTPFFRFAFCGFTTFTPRP